MWFAKCLTPILVVCFLPVGIPQAANVEKVKHPFLLWTADDLAALRRKIDTEPWARKAYDAMVASKEREGDELRHLFRYAVMGDREAGEIEKKKLLGLLKAPDPLGAALEWRILAYDILYDQLTADERAALESRFRRYIEYAIKPGGAYDTRVFNNERDYARYDGEDGRYTRTNWLPNIIFPWKISANLAAAVLRDEPLIRGTWAKHGSIQWYFDEYLGDSGFYFEEFSKMTSTPGALLLYCTALRNLGLDELGFGYRGKGGATMRGHIESVMLFTFPRVDLGSTRPRYERVSAGDVRPWLPFAHATVEGCFPDGRGGNIFWNPAGAWGGTTRGRSPQWDNDKTEKMTQRLWFEWGHKLWPDAGFDYFLAQMRAPDEAVYAPTLFFGIDPIAPEKVKAPPARSAVYAQRGFALLRAEEGLAHWESPAPAVCLRLTANYAHNVNDTMALCGFYAFNRPIYQNPKSDPGYAFKFSRSVRSHCAVMIDGHIKVDDWGQTGSIEPQFPTDCVTRHHFAPEVKFVAARTKKRYEGVAEERALALTREYLLDLYSCSAATPHSYVWIIHTIGGPDGDGGSKWTTSSDLAGLIGDLTNERSLPTGGMDWSVTVRQVRPKAALETSPLPDNWWARNIGVRLHMLGQPDTTAYLADTPKPRPGPRETLDEPMVDGTTVLASRRGNDAVFCALHVPFEGEPQSLRFERIAQTPDALAVRVVGGAASGVDDRILLRTGDRADQEVTLEGSGERFRFADFAFVRIGTDKVIVHGDLKAITLKTGERRPRLLLDGSEVRARYADGALSWGK